MTVLVVGKQQPGSWGGQGIAVRSAWDRHGIRAFDGGDHYAAAPQGAGRNDDFAAVGGVRHEPKQFRSAPDGAARESPSGAVNPCGATQSYRQ